MISFLLALIPGPWLAVLKKVPWRLIGYGVAALTVAILIYRVFWVWHPGYLRAEAAEKALATRTAELTQCTADGAARQAAFTAAAERAKSTEAADRAAADRSEHELQAKLAASAASSADLSRRLHDYEKRRCSSTLSQATGTPGQSPAPVAIAGSEEGTGAAIDAAHDKYHAACDLDAIAADGWWQWYQSVQANR